MSSGQVSTAYVLCKKWTICPVHNVSRAQNVLCTFFVSCNLSCAKCVLCSKCPLHKFNFLFVSCAQLRAVSTMQRHTVYVTHNQHTPTVMSDNCSHNMNFIARQVKNIFFAFQRMDLQIDRIQDTKNIYSKIFQRFFLLFIFQNL